MMPPGRYFSEDYHKAIASGDDYNRESPGLVAKWCQKEKIKTSAVALVLCLNIGVNPPGVVRVSPCAKMQCWVDPSGPSARKALETIGKNLQTQYQHLQPKAVCKLEPDPTFDHVKKLCQSLRKSHKAERVLFHFNGHGVPNPTPNGEIWVFNREYSKYIPLSIYEVHSWMMHPAIYVFDCASAGLLVDCFKDIMKKEQNSGLCAGGQTGMEDYQKDIVVLAACGANEVLPQDPEFPADLFTSCLTTPLKIALRWLLPRSLVHNEKVTLELIDKIPGSAKDRKTPLGELNWIFTAITDTIAWNVLPRELFQKLFRQDLLVASLFRNFLLAERVMSSVGVMPISHPRLPPTACHPMWQAWDMAAEQVLMQLPNLLNDSPHPGVFSPAQFFLHQLDSFKLWLMHGGQHMPPPRQLPIVLQVLLSPVHRLRALGLLDQFLELGSWGVDLALSVGIFPYVLKLLQTTTPELQQSLICIWAKIISLDAACQHDLIKDNNHLYFVKFLESGTGSLELNAKAVFVLAVMCDKLPKGQEECLESGMMTICKNLLNIHDPSGHSPAAWDVWQAACLCIGKMCEDNPKGILTARKVAMESKLLNLLRMGIKAEMRAAALFALGTMIVCDGTSYDTQASTFDQLFGWALNAIYMAINDPSTLVRAEAGCVLCKLACPELRGFLHGAGEMVQNAACRQQQGLKSRAFDNAESLHSAEEHLSSGHHATDDGLDGSAPMQHESRNEYAVCRHLVEAMCVLATDPHPQVAEIGHKALGLIQWELTQFPMNHSSHRHSLSAPSLQGDSSVRQTILKSRSGDGRGPRGLTGSDSLTALDSPQFLHMRMDLAPRLCHRLPITLRKLKKSTPLVRDSVLNQEIHGQQSSVHYDDFDTSGSKGMPDSKIFQLSRDAAAQPRGQQNRAFGNPIQQQRQLFDEHVGGSLCLETACLVEKPNYIETDLDTVACLMFDPKDHAVACAGRGGAMRIMDCSTGQCSSSFHVTGVDQGGKHVVFVDPVYMIALNDYDLDQVMVCSADGSVRILHGCTQENPKLLTAWQSIPVSMPQQFAPHLATFAWQPITGDLFAAGGSMCGMIFRVGLEYQSRLSQFSVHPEYHLNVDAICAYPRDPDIIATSTSDGFVKLFDVRIPHGPVAECKPFGQLQNFLIGGLAVTQFQGMERLAVLSECGKLNLLDIRCTGAEPSSRLEVGASIEAHVGGGACALASHSFLGMLASATLHPAVKAWTADLRQIGAHDPCQNNSGKGPITCMSFHPSKARFATGARGGICAVYDVEQSHAS